MKLHTLATLSLGAMLACTALSASAQQAKRSPYLIQLADAPVATYEGGVAGLEATKPAAGQRLDMASARVQAYAAYLDGKVTLAAAKVPAAPVYYRYGVVVNGFAAMLTPDELKALRADPAVKAVTADEAMQVDTSYTTSQFLGLGKAGGVWSLKDANGKDIKGENVIIAMVDGGVWPENVSVSDKVDANGKPVPYYAAGTVVYDPLPAGRYRGTCQPGEAFAASMCNNKLIGAQNFNATLNSVVPRPNVWPGEFNSVRDAGGHGTHTLTTAGGNANSDVVVGGAAFVTSGVAPRARLAAYKVCNQITGSDGVTNGSCFGGDSVAAINKAVADGVDVINFSISGDQTAVNGIVAQAMLGATKAGVFVAASAGNSGPGNQVAHVSPWVTTVGNSTHDRYTEAVVSLGNEQTVRGGSWQTAGLPRAQVILSTEAGVTPFGALTTNADRLALARCYTPADRTALGGTAAAALDPAKVAGKILVCIRGGNVFVNKSDSAKAAGAVGVIFQNVSAANAALGGPSANTVLALVMSLPAVHLPASTEGLVLGYAAGGAGSAAFAGAVQVPGVVAPIMAGSSSRGPNKFDTGVMKPDITGPGTDIIAGYVPDAISATERAGLIGGTVNGRQGANMISGTSMSSPHIAGTAALLRQANPTWSPAAIKSALMTSATQTVKLASGAADNDRWGFGSGHLAPQGAVATALVYDITNAQFDAYNARTLAGTNLNLASITFGNVLGVGTTTRTIKNTSASAVTINAAATLPGFDVTVTPASLTVPAGGTASYSVRVVKQAATPFNSYRFGDVVWTGSGQTVRSPLTARASALVAYSAVEDTRATGSRIFTVGTGFAGPMTTVPSGMVPATRSPGTVALDKSTCFAVAVPAGTLVMRAQLFNSETSAPDLDLEVYNAANTLVGGSGGNASDELVTLTVPAAGTYSVCVVGFAVGASNPAAFTLNTWVVGAPAGLQTLKAAGPSNAVLGGTASVVASWTATPGLRSLGVVQYREAANPANIGLTTVFVNAAAAAVATQAPLFSTKVER
jgi:subtilisin family serine protease